MRLRQLGTTQSITFIAPPEVHQSILDVHDNGSSDRLDSADVIMWLLDQTCKSNRELQSLYSAQGTDFCKRTQAAMSYSRFLSDADHQKSYLEVLRQPEQKTLEQLYEPLCRKDDGVLSSPVSVALQINGKLTTFMQQLTQSQQRSGVEEFNANSALQEVEQEREVAYEIEEEREVERPRVMEALKFPGLNDDIRSFLDTGLLSGTAGYIAASTVLGSTQLGMKYGIDVAPLVRHLYVSTEFTRTVKLRMGEKLDNLIVCYLPPFKLSTNLSASCELAAVEYAHRDRHGHHPRRSGRGVVHYPRHTRPNCSFVVVCGAVYQAHAALQPARLLLDPWSP